MDIAKSETFKNFIIWNKALLFLIKLSKTAVQSVPKLFLSSECRNHFVTRSLVSQPPNLHYG